MSASDSAVCEPKMKLMPPSVASATPMRGPETDCMMEETMGMLRVMRGSSPLR